MKVWKARLRNPRFRLAGTLIGILLLAACAVEDGAPASPRLDDIRVAGHTTQLGAVLEVGEALGLFRDEGLSLRLRRVESSKLSLPGLRTGEFDVVLGSLAAGSLNISTATDLRIIADGGRVLPSVVIRQQLWDSGGVRSIANIRGRRIRAPREGSSSYFALSRILESQGYSLEDVDLFYLEEDAAVAALGAAEIDVAILNEPHATGAVNSGVGRRVPRPELEEIFGQAGQQHMALFARRNGDDAYEELLTRFLSAYLAATEYYEKARLGIEPNRTEVVAVVARATGFPPTIIGESWWPYYSLDGVPDIAYMQQMADSFVQQGLVAKEVRIKSLVDLGPLSEAQADAPIND